MTKTDSVTVSFRGCCWSVRPRMLWQQLFNFYRKNGCPLDRMDNMLIDLRNCEQAFDDTQNGTVVFLWGIDPGLYRTTWVGKDYWKDVGLNSYLVMSGFEKFLLCELTEDEAKFEVMEVSDAY